MSVLHGHEAIPELWTPGQRRSKTPRRLARTTWLHSVPVLWMVLRRVGANRGRALTLITAMSAGTTAFTVLVGAAARGRLGTTTGTPDRAVWLLCALLLLTSFAGLVNVAAGTTRTMRAELTQQARLGVPRSAIVGHLLGETGLLALFAGLIGTGVAEAIAVVAGAPITLYRLLVTAPATCLIALAATSASALIATAVRPLDATWSAAAWRPHARTRMRVAVVQLLETPVRNALGATAVAIAGAVSFVQLTLLWADHRAFTGTLLGFTVTLRSGGVDAVANSDVRVAAVRIVS